MVSERSGNNEILCVMLPEKMWRGIKMEHMLWATKSGQSGWTKYRRRWKKLGSSPLILLLLSPSPDLCVHSSTASWIWTCAVNEHRPRKASTAGPYGANIWRWSSWSVWFAGSRTVLLPTAACVLPGQHWHTELGRIPAAPFHPGRLYTWILGSWSELSPVVWQWQASKLPKNCWRFCQ